MPPGRYVPEPITGGHEAPAIKLPPWLGPNARTKEKNEGDNDPGPGQSAHLTSRSRTHFQGCCCAP